MEIPHTHWPLLYSALLLVAIVVIAIVQLRRKAAVLEADASRLRIELQRAQSLLEAIPSPVFFKDAERRYIGCNRAFEGYVGYSRDTLLGKTVFDISPPDLATIYDAADVELLARRGSQTYEASVVYAEDGARRDVVFNKAPFVDATGVVRGLVGVITDVTQRKRLELALRKSEAQLCLALDVASMASWFWEVKSNEFSYTPGLAALFGFSRTMTALPYESFARRIHPDDEMRRRQAVSHAVRNGRELDVEFRVILPTGRIRWIANRGQVIRDEAGLATRILGIAMDVTESTELELAQKERDMQLRFALEAAAMATWHWELEPTLRFSCSDGLGPLFGKPRGQFFQSYQDFLAAIHAEDRAHVRSTIQAAIESEAAVALDCRVVWPDGSVHWLSGKGQVIRGSAGRLMTGVVGDVTEQKKAEQRIAYLAHHDALTGLPNRNWLAQRMARVIGAARETGAQVGVLFIDLNGFKRVNDTLGHQAGDTVLKAIAAEIVTLVHPVATVARIGGDEFVVLVDDVRDEDHLAAVAETLVEGLANAQFDSDVSIGASIGISVFPRDGDNAEDLIRHADSAMYAAKRPLQPAFQFFTEAMGKAAENRTRLENDLRHAIARRQMTVYYQPIFDAITQRIVSAEALLRWNHPALGPISPGQFIPIAEESGLIHMLGEWVLREAATACRAWELSGFDTRVAVNISANQLNKRNFCERLETILAETGASASRVSLEITEGAMIEESDDAWRNLKAVAALGVKFAVDDFGTGYSGLNSLKRYPISTLKIDRSFVQGIVDQNSDGAIVSAVIALGAALGMNVTAEGVETPQQLAFLRDEGCDFIQGFLLGTPVSGPELVKLLRVERETRGEEKYAAALSAVGLS